MKLRYAFKRTIANKSAGADKELKPEVPDGMLKKCNACKAAVFVDEGEKECLYLSALRQFISVFMQGEESKCWQMKEPFFEEWDKGNANK